MSKDRMALGSTEPMAWGDDVTRSALPEALLHPAAVSAVVAAMPVSTARRGMPLRCEIFN
ncbi:hypothetical protein GCM10010507_44290 [Streptomyces cinnamoneus]|uniref:FXSXX-COOH protein n=1 Tax=Streptomyces cinnamoneus TaxID=53446 RepID=A0A918WNB2_STRCJ|nr:hypothetical protein GCM10010507_44290 [Streptomyces cinnamoneus]